MESPKSSNALSISPDALTAHLDDETVVLHLGTKKYFHLNQTAQRVWELIEEELDEKSIVERLCEEFDVAPDVATRELSLLVESFRSCGLINSVN